MGEDGWGSGYHPADRSRGFQWLLPSMSVIWWEAAVAEDTGAHVGIGVSRVIGVTGAVLGFRVGTGRDFGWQNDARGYTCAPLPCPRHHSEQVKLCRVGAMCQWTSFA